MAEVGYYPHRLNRELNPREVAFAEQWTQDNYDGRLLTVLVGGKHGQVTKRDEKVAATIIQWLGSNVGMALIDGAMRKEPQIRQWLIREMEQPTNNPMNSMPTPGADRQDRAE